MNQYRNFATQLFGWRIVLVFFVFLFSDITFGQVTVEVSPIFSSISYSGSVKLGPDDEEMFELPHPPLKDRYLVLYKVRAGNVENIVIDKKDVALNNPSPVFLARKSLVGSSTHALPLSPTNKGTVVVFFNETRRPADFSYTVFRVGSRDSVVVRQLKKVLEIPLHALDTFYTLPKFKVAVVPCGTVNAFSSPDITICSELIADLYEKDLSDALYPILLHEVAHTLLNLWDLPGYDNEDVADQFAAAILSKVEPKHIEAFIKYLETADSTTEAIVQLTEGSRHTISIQRARNMKTAIQRIADVERRWENLLKPYRRAITTMKK